MAHANSKVSAQYHEVDLGLHITENIKNLFVPI